MGMFTDDYIMKICTGGSAEVANDQLSIMEIRRSVRIWFPSLVVWEFQGVAPPHTHRT